MAQLKFKEVVEKDVRLKRALRKLETGVYAIDIKQILAELRSLHELREVRSLNSKKIVKNEAGSSVLMDAILENQSKRSRIALIWTECYKISALLNEHIDTLFKYLMSEYNTVLKQEFSVLKSRQDAVYSALGRLMQRKSKLDMVLRIADAYLKDIDQSYWAVKTTAEVYMSERKRREI